MTRLALHTLALAALVSGSFHGGPALAASGDVTERENALAHVQPEPPRPEPRRRLVIGGDCQGCDFVGANLAGASLTRGDFTDSDFSGTQLLGARFATMALNGAAFSGALMAETRISDSDVREADFTGAVLSRARFQTCDLRSARLRGANLGHAAFSVSDLSGADLSAANLSHASFRSADLSGADLRSANLSHASLRDVVLRQADFTAANLSRAVFQNADLSGVDFRHAQLSGTVFTAVDLSGADLSQVVGLSAGQLSGACAGEAPALPRGLEEVSLSACDGDFLAGLREAARSERFIASAQARHATEAAAMGEVISEAIAGAMTGVRSDLGQLSEQEYEALREGLAEARRAQAEAGRVQAEALREMQSALGPQMRFQLRRSEIGEPMRVIIEQSPRTPAPPEARPAPATPAAPERRRGPDRR